MEVKVDIIKCAIHRVTPNEFIVLKLLEQNKLKEVETYIDYKSCLKLLDEKGFIENGVITRLGETLLSNPTQEEQWDSFARTYPRTDGARRLHNRPSVCKEKFNKLLKEYNFSEIMQGLKNELKVREQAKNKGQWIENWQLMSTYLNNKSWETYLDIEVIDKEELDLKKRML
jgi:hypothetical protein